MSVKLDVLVTKRMTLRPPLTVDAESIATALSNPNVSRNLSKVPAPYALSDAQEWISANGKKPCLFTLHREQLMGVAQVRDGAEMPMLGYWLAEPFWGKGYMSEAVRAVLAHAFRHYDVDIIGSYAFIDNPASLKIMEKMGFEQSGKGTMFNPTRGEGVPTIKTELLRENFEQRFGRLQEQRAA